MWRPRLIAKGLFILVGLGVLNSNLQTIESLQTGDDSSCVMNDSQRCTDLARAVDQQGDYVVIYNSTISISGVLAAGTIGYVTYALLRRKKSREKAAALRPSVGFGPNGVAFSLSGGF